MNTKKLSKLRKISQ